MKIALYFLSWMGTLLAFGTSTSAQESLLSNAPPTQLQRELNSSDGAIRYRLAERLANDHSKDTFTILLKLLNDKDDNISYAAAESIEGRKDTAFAVDLIAAIKGLPRDKIWPAYWAAKTYPTLAMLRFLQQRLDEEIQFQRHRATFYNQNYFYLAQSLGQIASCLKIHLNVSVPDGDDLSSYERFAKALTQFGNNTSKQISGNGTNALHYDPGQSGS